MKYTCFGMHRFSSLKLCTVIMGPKTRAETFARGDCSCCENAWPLPHSDARLRVCYHLRTEHAERLHMKPCLNTRDFLTVLRISRSSVSCWTLGWTSRDMWSILSPEAFRLAVVCLTEKVWAKVRQVVITELSMQEKEWIEIIVHISFLETRQVSSHLRRVFKTEILNDFQTKLKKQCQITPDNHAFISVLSKPNFVKRLLIGVSSASNPVPCTQKSKPIILKPIFVTRVLETEASIVVL